jgi:lipopolysaccharide/colanic/teichoic acid biosynthesis glycosyltransferase
MRIKGTSEMSPGNYQVQDDWLDSTELYINAYQRKASVKRIFDLSIVLMGAALWVPLLALVWAVVKFSSPGRPALYWQVRTGQFGRRFAMVKIRTMCAGAEGMLADLLDQNETSGPQFKIRNDPRVTRIGKVLRQTHLDELPQVYNIIKGDMSLVGPRPAGAGVDQHKGWWRARLDMPPGLTGLWQVRRTGMGTFDDRVRNDLAYIRNQSLTSDLWLLVETFGCCIHRNGC